MPVLTEQAIYLNEMTDPGIVPIPGMDIEMPPLQKPREVPESYDYAKSIIGIQLLAKPGSTSADILNIGLVYHSKV